MQTFIGKIRPLLFSEDEVLRHAWLFQLHDYPAVPVELVNELIAFCQVNKVTRRELLSNLENSPKNEQSIELLLEWVREVPFKEKREVVRFLQNVEPKIVVHFKDDLMYFMGRDYIELCEKLIQYETSQNHDFEPLWHLYGELCDVLEKNYHPQQLALLKHIINTLIHVGEYDAKEAKLVIADEMQRDYFSINGLMAIYAAGVMQLEELIPQFVELMQRDNEDELIQLLHQAMIRLQSEDVAKAVAPSILNTKNGIFISASMILKEVKIPFAEKALVDAYKQTTNIEIKEFLLDALTSHFSVQAFPLIEDFLVQNKTARAFDMDLLFYSFYKAMSQEHPLLATWRTSIVEREARIEQEVQSIVVKDILREKYGKVGRNDPCICGSGKKYKKCCGK